MGKIFEGYSSKTKTEKMFKELDAKVKALDEPADCLQIKVNGMNYIFTLPLDPKCPENETHITELCTINLDSHELIYSCSEPGCEGGFEYNTVSLIQDKMNE